MKKILVTGATGFTGYKLCSQLIKNGHSVVAFVRSTSFTDPLIELGVECRVVDIKDAHSIDKHFERFDIVYHIAAAYRTEHSDRSEFKAVNVDATKNLLDASKRHDVGRFVHCSTVGVQGEIKNPPANENYRVKPGDHYQESKLDGEMLAQSYFEEGLPGCVVRPVGIYGPGDTRFLKLFKAVQSGKFVMIGSGKTLYHMTYIDDLVAGFILAGVHPNALGEVFTIAGSRYTDLDELVALVSDILGKKRPWIKIPLWPVFGISIICEKLCRLIGVNPPLYPRRVEFFKLDRAFSIDKAIKLLNYEPKVDLSDGLMRTAQWYKQKGLLK